MAYLVPLPTYAATLTFPMSRFPNDVCAQNDVLVLKGGEKSL